MLQLLRMGEQWGWARRILFGTLVGIGLWTSAKLVGHIDRFWPVVVFIACWNAALLVGFAFAERPRRGTQSSALD